MLDLDDCCLGDDGVAKALPGPAPIQELLLGENNVSTVGAAAVGALVAQGQCRRLDLGFNMLGYEGVEALMEGCQNPTGLVHLSLRDNEIYVDGAKSLAAGLVAGCSRLLSLNLRRELPYTP